MEPFIAIGSPENRDDVEPAHRPTDPVAAATDALLPHFIRAEANLLRLPLFALHTKGLKTLDGIECRAKITRDGQTHHFTFRATRNTATFYPGPVARAAHLAFLSMLTERGLPLENPLTWTWRDLCGRLRVNYGGWMVRCLKRAIQSTAGLLIQSEYALYSKPDAALLHTHQDALHLYDRVTFAGSPLPDGTVADTNYLWLSPWYLANLNGLYTAPLDYTLWRYLDGRSPIASRLYEFLTINFYRDTPVLRINYETLAQYLPVRPERYRSQAVQQLSPALRLLAATGVIAASAWRDSKQGLAQLQLYRGTRLQPAAGRDQPVLPLADGEETFAGTIELTELRNLKPLEWTMVEEFYRLWTGQAGCRPTPKELELAKSLVAEFGPAKAKGLIPPAVKQMKVHFPDAKSFGAIRPYVADAATEYNRQQRAAEHRREERAREQQATAREAEQVQESAALKVLWDALPAADREAIRQHVLAGQPNSLAKHPALVQRLCLRELASRHPSNISPATPRQPKRLTLGN